MDPWSILVAGTFVGHIFHSARRRLLLSFDAPGSLLPGVDHRSGCSCGSTFLVLYICGFCGYLADTLDLPYKSIPIQFLRRCTDSFVWDCRMAGSPPSAVFRRYVSSAAVLVFGQIVCVQQG